MTSVSADMGVNIGLSGSAGLFSATGKEVDTGPNLTETTEDAEHGEAAFSSIFLEKTLGDRFTVGIDWVLNDLSTDTVESRRQDKTTGTSSSNVENKIQIDFENLTTYYINFNVSENLYAKVGMATVDIITGETLGTGSTYGNTDMDGTVLGVGYNATFGNSAFIRVEGNYMDFDGASLTSSTGVNKVSLNNLDGVTGKLSIGKSF
tara:strand:- start:242 stop:859 length:618 start_codon:yes stop_codon:yes gene_type:complete